MFKAKDQCMINISESLARVNISRLYQLPKGEYIRSSNCFPGSVSSKELFRHSIFQVETGPGILTKRGTFPLGKRFRRVTVRHNHLRHNF
jgi:hypothetical protein